MTTDGGIRASDKDRESTAEVLREAYAAGRLDLGEFDERTSAAYAAKTWGELRTLTEDLPAEPDLGADLPVRAQRSLDQGQADPGTYGPRRPFIPMLPMALIWIAIAAMAGAPEAVLPLVILAIFALCMAGWRRKPPDPPARQDGGLARRWDDAA